MGNAIAVACFTLVRHIHITMSQTYIKNNILQPAALMSRELAAKVQLTVPGLKKPSSKTDDPGANNFPYDYYTSPVQIQYPDNSNSNTFFLPEVTIYNLPRAAGTSTRYPLAFSRGFVAYFEPALKRAYSGAGFIDTRYADTPSHVWTEMTIYAPDPSRNSTSSKLRVEVPMVKNGVRNKFSYDDLADFFRKTLFVAVKADIVCTMKLQAQVTKGSPLPSTAAARPVFTPTAIMIRGKMDVPQPVSNSTQVAVATEINNADDDFWKLMQELNAGGDDEDNDEGPVSSSRDKGKSPAVVGDEDEEEFEDEV
jgi:hypothetical protein